MSKNSEFSEFCKYYVDKKPNLVIKISLRFINFSRNCWNRLGRLDMKRDREPDSGAAGAWASVFPRKASGGFNVWSELRISSSDLFTVLSRWGSFVLQLWNVREITCINAFNYANQVFLWHFHPLCGFTSFLLIFLLFSNSPKEMPPSTPLFLFIFLSLI